MNSFESRNMFWLPFWVELLNGRVHGHYACIIHPEAPLKKYEKIPFVLKGSASLQAPLYLIILGKCFLLFCPKSNEEYPLLDFIFFLREKLILKLKYTELRRFNIKRKKCYPVLNIS